jgi:putative tryptophan/tyrosine transport system substrate-binding protein
VKKTLVMLSCLLACSALVLSCGSSSKVKKIGVVQLVEHAALDASYQGFVDGLKAAGYEDGKNIKLDFQNAQGEQANCATIAQKLINDKSDLILAIATPAAQAVANLTKKIPILVTAVTDPASAKLVATNEAPGGNVTGTSDLNPVEAQIELIKQIVPKATTIGFIYNSSEQNSKFQIDLAKKAADKLGLKYVEATVSNSNEIQQVAQSLVGKVQAVYAPTDNMIAAGMPTVSGVLTPAKIPLICGEAGMVKAGGLATYGVNYYELGKQTATMAVAILKDGKKPGDLPIQYQQNLDFTVNTDIAKKIGITIPAELLAKVKQ